MCIRDRYTDQILPSTGPETFNGLPGTILGLATEDGGVVYFAKKIEKNSNEVDELVGDLKIKKTYTEKELRTELEIFMFLASACNSTERFFSRRFFSR